LDLTDVFDAAVFSCDTTAFSCNRLGKLTVPSSGTFNTLKHVSKGAPTSFSRVRNGVEYASFHIPWSKTTKEEGADIILTAVPGPLNPVAAFRHHLSANASVPDDAPLFAFE